MSRHLFFSMVLIFCASSAVAGGNNCATLVEQLFLGDITISSLTDGAAIGRGDSAKLQASSNAANNAAIANIISSQQKMLFLMKELGCDFKEVKFDPDEIFNAYLTIILNGN